MNNYIYNNEPKKKKTPIKLKFERTSLILALVGLMVIIIQIASKSNSVDVMEQGGEIGSPDLGNANPQIPQQPTMNELGIPVE